jgi:hypothetical protein
MNAHRPFFHSAIGPEWPDCHNDLSYLNANTRPTMLHTRPTEVFSWFPVVKFRIRPTKVFSWLEVFSWFHVCKGGDFDPRGPDPRWQDPQRAASSSERPQLHQQY